MEVITRICILAYKTEIITQRAREGTQREQNYQMPKVFSWDVRLVARLSRLQFSKTRLPSSNPSIKREIKIVDSLLPQGAIRQAANHSGDTTLQKLGRHAVNFFFTHVCYTVINTLYRQMLFYLVNSILQMLFPRFYYVKCYYI